MTPIHLIADVYAVKVPEGAKDFELEIDANEDWYYLIYFLMIDDEDSGFYGEDQQHSVELPPGSWQIICTTKGVTEDVAKTIAQVFAANLRGTYRNHEWPQGPDFYTEAVASVRSLVRSKGLDPDNTLIIKNDKL